MQPRNVLPIWNRVRRLPGGRRLFSRALGLLVPYTGTIRADIVELERGFARVQLHDRRAVRNHLRSVHAVAIVNLAELTASLAVSTAQPADGRWIVTGLDTEYLKKARGTITAECRMPDIDWSSPRDVTGEVICRDGSGTVVARTRPRWRIGPVPSGAR